MTQRLAIMGWAQTRHKRRRPLDNDWDIIYPTVKAALKDAGVVFDEVDVCIDASSDYLDGRGISNFPIVDGLGGQLKEEAKVSMDGAFAFIYAAMRLLGGPFEVAIIPAYGKSGQTVDVHWQTNTLFDPFYGQEIGLDALSAAALQASAYFAKYKVTEEQAALVPIKNRANGLRNPNAHVKGKYTVEDVMDSRPLVKPIKFHDASPISEGAAALVLVKEKKALDIARRTGKKPVWLLGMGHAQDSFSLGVRDLTKAKSAEIAAKRAFKLAGIKKPLKEIHAAEIYEPFGFQELMMYEALGFCKSGDGARLVEEKVTDFGGALPVNPSGGALCANPIHATGLIRIIEAAAQIAGRAGRHQLKKKVKRAIATSTNGPAMQGSAVFVLGGD